MPDVSAQTHTQILTELADSRRDVVTLRNATQVMTGYMGFELAERALIECRAAMEAVKDQARIVTMLKIADAALALYGGGDVAPSVDRARRTLKSIWEGLEPQA